jgi:hypothetical protein
MNRPAFHTKDTIPNLENRGSSPRKRSGAARALLAAKVASVKFVIIYDLWYNSCPAPRMSSNDRPVKSRLPFLYSKVGA